MSISRRTLTLALAITPNIGAKTITRILTKLDLYDRDPDEFIKLGQQAYQEEFKMSRSAAEKFHQLKSQSIQQAVELDQTLSAYGVTAVTAADAHYPRQIEIFDPHPPELLYFYGNNRLLTANTFCVLSSRNTSPEGMIEIEKACEFHILRSRTLVTGTNTNEYQRAALTALRWGSPRILVLDTGFFNALGQDLTEEPFAAARLWRYKFDPRTDLAVSAVNPYHPYFSNANRIRDRIVGGLSMHLDGICIKPGGNMDRLLHLGLRAGRHVQISELSPHHQDLTKSGAQFLPLLNR
jgi:DNA processing protein